MKGLVLLSVLLFSFAGLFAESKEVPFTLEDRDRMIKMEERLNSIEQRLDLMHNDFDGKLTSLRNEMNTRFEAIDSKFDGIDSRFEAIDSKLNVLYWGFGIIITLILFLFAYIVFDRRNTIKPLEQDVSVLKYRQDNLGKVINEYAKKDKAFAEALKKVAF